jgi:hypothetical protein
VLNAVRQRPGALLVNLGPGRGYSVLEMVRAFATASGKPVPYRVVGRRPGDIAQCNTDPALPRDARPAEAAGDRCDVHRHLALAVVGGSRGVRSPGMFGQGSQSPRCLRLIVVCPAHLAATPHFALATGFRLSEMTGLELSCVASRTTQRLQGRSAWVACKLTPPSLAQELLWCSACREKRGQYESPVEGKIQGAGRGKRLVARSCEGLCRW